MVKREKVSGLFKSPDGTWTWKIRIAEGPGENFYNLSFFEGKLLYYFANGTSPKIFTTPLRQALNAIKDLEKAACAQQLDRRGSNKEGLSARSEFKYMKDHSWN